MTDTATVLPLRWRPTLDFADRLRLVRLDYAHRLGRRVSQRDLATLIGVKAPTYGSWEAGNSKPADLIETAQAIFRVTGADPAWLLDVADDDDNGPNVPPGQGIPPYRWRNGSAGQRVPLRAVPVLAGLAA